MYVFDGISLLMRPKSSSGKQLGTSFGNQSGMKSTLSQNGLNSTMMTEDQKSICHTKAGTTITIGQFFSLTLTKKMAENGPVTNMTHVGTLTKNFSNLAMIKATVMLPLKPLKFISLNMELSKYLIQMLSITLWLLVESTTLSPLNIKTAQEPIGSATLLMKKTVGASRLTSKLKKSAHLMTSASLWRNSFTTSEIGGCT
jgi:hypothetical protein